ncbi:Hypothetical predicted protein [Octopus vulgaris]|uniref:Uncharacterized protein n=1 Tax=Octopus vulgaris TaxID=6645 RepID=A0AA36B5M7_OCTVU|nr:Hypothetical predicted protein [Octopus vulgaris]
MCMHVLLYKGHIVHTSKYCRFDVRHIPNFTSAFFFQLKSTFKLTVGIDFDALRKNMNRKLAIINLVFKSHCKS